MVDFGYTDLTGFLLKADQVIRQLLGVSKIRNLIKGMMVTPINIACENKARGSGVPGQLGLLKSVSNQSKAKNKS
jgi:hypothetical protein